MTGKEDGAECPIAAWVREIVDEPLAERRLALSRRLRAEIWALMSEEDRRRVAQRGSRSAAKEGALREVT